MEKPKTYTCASFLAPSSSGMAVGNCDLVAGGDNGFVFLFRKCMCVAVVDAFHNGVVSSLTVSGGFLMCGGSRGAIVHLDTSTLGVIQTYSALPEDGRGVTPTNILGGPSQRSQSASSGSARPSNVSGRRAAFGKLGEEREGAGGGTRSNPGDISRKGRCKGPPSRWEGPRDQKRVDDSLPVGVRASTDVQGLVVLGVRDKLWCVLQYV